MLNAIEAQSQHQLLVQMLEDSLALGDIYQLTWDEYLQRIRFTQTVEMCEPEYNEPIVWLKRERIRVGQGSRIDSFTKLEGGEGLEIGRHVHIASLAHINVGGGRTIIGDYCAVASGGKIVSGGNRPSGVSMSASAPKELQVIERGVVELKPYAAVLTNATVLPGVTLHEGALLASGGVATRDIPAWEIWGGVPARFLCKREVNRAIQEDFTRKE